MTNAEGQLKLSWYTTGTTMQTATLSFVGGNSQLQGVTDFSRSLTKTPVEVPIPQQDSVSFDIGLTESDSINVHAILYDGWGGTIDTLVKAFKYRTTGDGTAGVDTSNSVKPYKLEFGEYFSEWVTFKNLSANMTMGHGYEINVTMMFGVVKEQT
jgi:hypothetical protein